MTMLFFNRKKIEEYYKEDKFKIAKYNLWENLTVRKLELSRQTVQRAYKEMKKMEFNGDIIEYLCFDSLLQLVSYIQKSFKELGTWKRVFTYIDSHLYVNIDITIPACRLVLKDENYLIEAFKFYDIKTDGKMFIETKKMLTKKINLLLTYEPEKKKYWDPENTYILVNKRLVKKYPTIK